MNRKIMTSLMIFFSLFFGAWYIDQEERIRYEEDPILPPAPIDSIQQQEEVHAEDDIDKINKAHFGPREYVKIRYHHNK